MTRQRAQYLRRAIPRLKTQRISRCTITFDRVLTPDEMADYERHSRTWARSQPPGGFWIDTEPINPRGFWRSLFGR